MPSTHDMSPAPVPSDELPPSTGRSILVGLIIAMLVISTLAMVGFIWYRWSGVREPTTAVIIQGDASLEGAVITVAGSERTITAKLDNSNQYVTPILLEPGVYLVRVERYGQLLVNRDVEVKRFFGVQFNLTEYVKKATAAGVLAPLAPAPDPSTEPATPTAKTP